MRIFAIVWLMFIGTQNTLAENARFLDLAVSGDVMDLNNQVEYLVDPQGELTIDRISDRDWQMSGRDSLSFGYTSDVYWFRITFENTGDKTQERLLEIGYPVLDNIDLFRRQITNENSSSPWLQSHYGDKQAFDTRPIEHRFFILPLKLNSGEKQAWVFRVETSSSMQFPLKLWSERSFFLHELDQLFGMGIYYGIMLIMVLYNLFVFVSARESNYLYYVLYVASMAVFLSSLQGISFQYLWPEATTWNDQSIVVFLAGVVVFGGLFTINFLRLKDDMQWLGRIFSGVIVAAVVIVFLSNLLSYQLMIRSLIAVAIIGIGCAIYGGVVRWSQGYSSARFYTIAWSSMLLGGVILAMNKFDIIPRNFFTEYAVQIGSALEVILLSFALADRLNQEKRERFEAQLAAFEHEKIARVAQEDALTQERNARHAQEKALEHEKEAREAQDKALNIQRKANETLEARVKERTNELEELNRKLEYLSTTDALTTLRNRRYFEDVIEREMARAIRESECLCIIMIDIDHFKRINDEYGHLAGDDVIRTVAQAVKHSVHRDTDFIARYGGEEFIMVLPNTGLGGAKHVAESLRGTISQLKFDRIEPGMRVTVSLGMHGGVPERADHSDVWIKCADDALYYSKEHGRNRVTAYADTI